MFFSVIIIPNRYPKYFINIHIFIWIPICIHHPYMRPLQKPHLNPTPVTHVKLLFKIIDNAYNLKRILFPFYTATNSPFRHFFPQLRMSSLYYMLLIMYAPTATCVAKIKLPMRFWSVPWFIIKSCVFLPMRSIMDSQIFLLPVEITDFDPHIHHTN